MDSRYFISLARVFLIFSVLGLILSGSQSTFAEEAASTQSLELRFVANEGVMLSSGKTRVLVDALFVKPHPDYNAPSKDTIEKMVQGVPPFDRIDLVLVTHNHADHFDPQTAARFLTGHPEALLVAPADATQALKEAATHWDDVRGRVLSLDLEVGEKMERGIKGITIRAYRTLHSGDRTSPHNLMYLIEMGGWQILHEGDSDGHPETFKKFGLGEERIDLALVHFWFPLDPGMAKFLQEILQPAHIALIHLPIRLEGDAPTKIEMVAKYYKDIFLLLPGMKPRVFTR